MKKLVTISREYGSGGRMIGQLIARKLNVPFFDKDVIDAAIMKQGYSKETIEEAELKAKNGFSYGLSLALFRNDVGGAESLSLNEKIFLANYNVIQEICKGGEGVIVGRCADYILDEVPGVTNVFCYAELEDRVARAIDEYNIDKKNALKVVEDYDKSRHNYYKYHTGKKWGDAKNYNLMINTSYISLEATADLVCTYVNKRTYKD